MKTHRSLSNFVLVGVLATLLMLVSSAFAVSNTTTFSGNIASGAQYDLYLMELTGGDQITATLVCDFDGVSRPLDPVLSVYNPGSDSSDTINADFYNDDGFGLDDDPNGVECDAFDSSRVIFVAPVTGTYTFRADGFGSATGPYTLTITVVGGGNPMLVDGRINGQQAAPIILYCDGTTLNGFDVNGAPLFSVENGGTASGTWGSVGTAPDGRMLVSGWFTDGKAYYFAFEGCPHGKYDAFSGEPPQVFDSGSY